MIRPTESQPGSKHAAPAAQLRLATFDERELRNKPAREPAHGPRNRNEKDGGDGDDERAPEITPTAGGEDKLARGALNVSAHPARPGGGDPCPTDDGDNR